MKVFVAYSYHSPNGRPQDAEGPRGPYPSDQRRPLIFFQGVLQDALVEVTVIANGQVWKSDYEAIRFPGVNMRS